MIVKNAYMFLLSALLLLFSCNEDRKTISITLIVQNSPSAQVISLIGKDYGQQPLILDTAMINAGSSTCTFEIVGSSPGIYSLAFEKDGRYILLSNDEPVINLSVNWNKFSDYSISSPASASLKGLLVSFNAYLYGIDSLRTDTTQNRSDSIRNVRKEQILEKQDEAKHFLAQFTDSTKNPAVAVYALGILQQQQNDSNTMKPLIKRLAARFPVDVTVSKLNQDYDAWLKKQSIAAIGKPAPLFSLPDTTGQKISLQSLKGKYVLVDFWASWCGPCRKENPNIVKAYADFKDRNFTVLGVSLDDNKQAWLDAIYKDGLAWQQVSDLKKWESDVVSLYNIEAIPYNVLLDAEGKIIANNLRGEELQKKLAEILSPVVTP